MYIHEQVVRRCNGARAWYGAPFIIITNSYICLSISVHSRSPYNYRDVMNSVKLSVNVGASQQVK